MSFIGQELEDVLPSMVVTANNELQSKAVKYSELLPIIIKRYASVKDKNSQLSESK